MVAYNFKAQFADDVESGKKRQTIRLQRRARVGDALQLYTGMRTKKCRKLRDAVCTAVHEITVERVGYYAHFVAVQLDGELLPADLAREVAIADGFENLSAFADFFAEQYGLPFHGYLTRWE